MFKLKPTEHLLSDLGHVPSRQKFKVPLQLTVFDDAGVLGPDVGFAKLDVVPHRGVLDPRLLGHVGDAALRRNQPETRW